MKLSYFSYDFWECCCEAVKPGVCVGCFRWAWLLRVPVGGGPPASPGPTQFRMQFPHDYFKP